MTDIYTQENGSKKKFLAPVLVILLCMVSLTAAGYAYSATVTNDGDDVIIEGIEMKLTDASGEVTKAMYNVDDLNIATHTVNGKAARYGGDAFLTASSVETYTNDHLDTYLNGYYVQALKGEDAAGYHAASDYTTEQAIIDATNVYKIGNGETQVYTLDVNNQSGKAASVKATTDGLADIFAKPYINSMYVVIKGTTTASGASPVAITPVIAKVTSEADITVLAALPNGSTATLTVEAYIELTDFYLENAGYATLLNDLSFEFMVQFTANVAA